MTLRKNILCLSLLYFGKGTYGDLEFNAGKN